ncbi:MAG: hypothetical protein ACT4P6_03765 [Gemmatimonadaceae bacterium]
MGTRVNKQWRALRQRHPFASIMLVFLIVVLIATNGWAAARWLRYSSEAERLRANMSDVEKAKVDVELADEGNRLRVMLELLRRQARGDRDLHLAVVVDSGVMRLQRSGAVLRSMPVRVGPERAVGSGPDAVRIVAPRGERTVSRVVTARQAWAVPGWVYRDRGLSAPNDTVVRGGLGPLGIVLSDGTVIYTTPAEGPLADSVYVLPGSVRAERSDLQAIAPNLNPGMKVYFYD